MKTIVRSTVLVALIAAPLQAQPILFDHTAAPSLLFGADVRDQRTTATNFTHASPRVQPARIRSSLERQPRSPALSYTVSEELFGSSDRGRNTLKGALIGGTVGFVLGAIGGTQIGTGCETTTSSKCNARRNMVLGMGGVAAGFGAIIGAGIGAIL
jgi:hypothetical protein